MVAWTFLDYVDAHNSNPIEDWLETLRPPGISVTVRSKMTSIFLVANAVGTLQEPRFEKLKGAHSDLIRIGFEDNKIAYRVFACYGNEGRGVVWLLAGGKERNNKYRPPGVLDTALLRRANILNGIAAVRPTCLQKNN